MKDEAMAESFASSFDYTDNSNYENKYQKESEKIAYESYLAGLKAGRTQWHNVADGDLPEEGTEVLNDDGVQVVRINGHWRYVHGDEWEDDAHLDHWCEIPQFKED